MANKCARCGIEAELTTLNFQVGSYQLKSAVNVCVTCENEYRIIIRSEITQKLAELAQNLFERWWKRERDERWWLT